MLTNTEEILEILRPRVYNEELHGFYDGRFNSDKDKLVVVTYVQLDSNDYEKYNSLFADYSSYSYMGVDKEKTKIYLDNNQYTSKPLEECIKEKVFTAYSLLFTGAFIENEWFILRDLTFYGDKIDENDAKNRLESYSKDSDSWQTGAFEVDRHLKTVGKEMHIRDIDLEQFPGIPWLVSHLKSEKKAGINRAFSHYMNLSQVQPFLKQLRIKFFEEFAELHSLYGSDYLLLFPELKDRFLVVAMAKHQILGYRLVWFYYDSASNKFYRWNYPKPRFSSSSYHYSQDVIDDIHSISGWDDFDFLTSSRTLDDPHFWSEYVLKKVNGKFMWLEEIIID
jgi:hypothetical protein